MKKTSLYSTVLVGCLTSVSQAALTAVTSVDSLSNVAQVTTAAGTVDVTSGIVRAYGAGAFNPGSPSFPGNSTHSELDDNSVLTGVAGSVSFTFGDYSLSFASNVTDNDAGLDFFFFEDGGNDSGTIYAVLANGTLSSGLTFTPADFGSDISGGTGVLNNSGTPLTGRPVAGFGFDLTDLGVTAGTEIQGIVIDTASAADAYAIFANVEAVPEPSTTALLGLGGLAMVLRRRK
ncbi:hypothetical protein NT6N_18810 [Oceaniferula spumae]|uniref:Ice-binding protein C-terminal domain-containing protein n=1 Tax=Oceaniferula spumae TaxID=2979115 RepID=A0AAT9FLP0_9BACT